MNIIDRPTCTNTGHPVAVPGEVVWDTDKATYVDLTCPTCGRSQGIRRVKKEVVA